MSARRALLLFLLAWACPAISRAEGAPDLAEVLLEDGKPVHASVLAGKKRWNGRLVVPSDAVALGVVLSGTAEVNLYLRYLEPIRTLDEADVASRSDSLEEVVTITPFSEAPLRAGVWYVAVEAPGAEPRAVPFDLVAFVDRASATHTVLPGRAVSATLGGAGSRLAFRTYMPRDAISLSLEVSARESADLHFELAGPDGYRREGRGAPRLLVAREEAPAGPYTLTITASAEPAARRVTAQARWDVGPGRTPPMASDPLLEQGQPLTFVMGGKEPDVRHLRVVVPRGTQGFSLEAEEESGADVDLYVRRGRPIDDGVQDAEWLGLTTGSRERLVVGGSEPLPPGTYYVWGVLLDDKTEREVTLSLDPFTNGRSEATWGSGMPPTLPEGIWLEGTVRPEASGITWHAIDVAAGTAALHARLIEASAPLDLVLAQPRDGAIFARSLTSRADETISYAFEKSLDRPRRVFIGVVCRETGETLVHYRLAASTERPPDPPPDLQWPPVLRGENLSVLERAAAATVELTTEEGGGGSGTCVTPGGLILSCRHVLATEGERNPDRIQRTGILVAFSQRLDMQPVQAYVARVVVEDDDLDLVLLQPVEDVFGRALPKDLSLPWLPLGDSSTLRLGDPIAAVGYPEGGSTRTRTAVLVSRGTVSGFERAPGQPVWLKTDAWIAPGHSGGAIVDSVGRLVAVPNATLGTGERLGICLPVELLPSEWKSRIQKGLR